MLLRAKQATADLLSINGALKLIKSQIDVGFQRQREISRPTGNQEKHRIFVFLKTGCAQKNSH